MWLIGNYSFDTNQNVKNVFLNRIKISLFRINQSTTVHMPYTYPECLKQIN